MVGVIFLTATGLKNIFLSIIFFHVMTDEVYYSTRHGEMDMAGLFLILSDDVMLLICHVSSLTYHKIIMLVM